MAEKENDNHSLADYLKAVKENNNHDLIKILTSKIEKVPIGNKIDLTTFLVHRAEAYFKIDDYSMVLNDCIKLKTMGYEYENDEKLALILVECQMRIISEELVKLLEKISIKFNNRQASNSANKISTIDMNKMFTKK